MSALRKAVWTVLTAVWTIGLLVVMQNSQPEVMLVLWAGGEAVVSGVCFLTTEPVHFVAAPYPDRSRTREQLERERREHQEQQWEQARMAWLMTPEQQQKPPPTDNYRGF